MFVHHLYFTILYYINTLVYPNIFNNFYIGIKHVATAAVNNFIVWQLAVTILIAACATIISAIINDRRARLARCRIQANHGW